MTTNQERDRQRALAAEFSAWIEPLLDGLSTELEPDPPPDAVTADDLMDAIRKDTQR